jgi:threonine/homoserine/homoserine lactone efflux protein
MNTSTLLAFALVALVTVVTPGPTVLLALNNGSRHGLRIAAMGILGAVLSDFVLIAAVALGLGALLAASELAFSVLKWLGVAYLAFLGLQLLRPRRQTAPMERAGLEAVRERVPGGPRAVFLKSLAVALSNPKGLLFFSALLPQFVDPAALQWPQYLALAFTFAAIDAVVMAGYALVGSHAMGRLQQVGARWLDRVCGGTLLALAASLAFYRRTSTGA